MYNEASMNPRYDLLLPKDYVRDAAKRCRKAKQRVYLLSMVVLDDEITHELIESVLDAAKRGVEVCICADTYTFSEGGAVFKPNSQKSKNIKQMQKKLKQSGVKFFWLGMKSTSLMNGRTHSKWLIIDNTVYSFGGVNLYAGSIKFNDFMLRVADKNIADRLTAEQQRIIKADSASHSYRSHKFGDDTSQVLVDGGFIGDSIIYRHACRLAEKATHILYVSQYCPGGKLGRLLKKRHSLIYFNRWQQASFVNKLRIRLAVTINRIKTPYQRDAYLHAKYIVYTMPDGEKIAITGSHNFATGGVMFGTREIALETKDKRIIRQLESFFDKHVA